MGSKTMENNLPVSISSFQQYILHPFVAAEISLIVHQDVHFVGSSPLQLTRLSVLHNLILHMDLAMQLGLHNHNYQPVLVHFAVLCWLHLLLHTDLEQYAGQLGWQSCNHFGLCSRTQLMLSVLVARSLHMMLLLCHTLQLPVCYIGYWKRDIGLHWRQLGLGRHSRTLVWDQLAFGRSQCTG